jgi:hypothetical protein
MLIDSSISIELGALIDRLRDWHREIIAIAEIRIEITVLNGLPYDLSRIGPDRMPRAQSPATTYLISILRVLVSLLIRNLRN